MRTSRTITAPWLKPVFFGFFALFALGFTWFVGGSALNDYAATHGHGVTGTFTPHDYRCHTTHSRHGGSHRSCDWYGTFEANDASVVLEDVTADGTSSGRATAASYAHIVPGTSSNVVVGNRGWIEKLVQLGFLLFVVGLALTASLWKHHAAVRVKAATDRALDRAAAARGGQPVRAQQPQQSGPTAAPVAPAAPVASAPLPTQPARGDGDIPGLTRY